MSDFIKQENDMNLLIILHYCQTHSSICHAYYKKYFSILSYKMKNMLVKENPTNRPRFPPTLLIKEATSINLEVVVTFMLVVAYEIIILLGKLFTLC